MLLAFLVLATSGILAANAQCQTSLSWKNAPSMKDSGLTSFVIASMTKPRGIRFVNDTLLVIDVGVGLVSLRENVDNCNGWTKTVLVQNADLNHGLVVNGTQIYASSVDTVFRYEWNPSTRTVSGNEQIVTGMDLAANHKTRTLDISGTYLLVSSGASENLETEATSPSHGTAQIRRFAINSTVPSGGYTWFQGELVAVGMRNAVGIAVAGNNLWTVENSADELNYTSGSQLVDIHEDNPAEELNVVDLSDIGHSYGYPECFTAWDMKEVIPDSALNTGDQFSIVPNVTDAQCGNTTFNKAPRLSMQAHSAPLDIVFYKAPSNVTAVTVKPEYNSHAFVSFHGSWNRDPPTGYGIVRIPWSGNEPTAQPNAKDGYSFVLQGDLTRCPDGCFRPVGLAFDSTGRLFGSSDSTGEIFIIQAGSSGATSKLVGGSSCLWFAMLLVSMLLCA